MLYLARARFTSSCSTAKGREVDREKGIALGANDYVTKPFSTRDLTDKVKQLLENSTLDGAPEAPAPVRR